MLEPLFFALGLANSLFLLFIFIIRRNHLELLKKVGWLYLLLAIPAVAGLLLVRQEGKDYRYTVFLLIFLAFLAIEALYDWILKLPFREQADWRILTPYLVLYMSMNYGFVMMVWKYTSLAGGILLLVLFILQLITNLLTHPPAAAGDGKSRMK